MESKTFSSETFKLVGAMNMNIAVRYPLMREVLKKKSNKTMRFLSKENDDVFYIFVYTSTSGSRRYKQQNKATKPKNKL